MGAKPIEENEAPTEPWPDPLTGDVIFEIEPPVDPGSYVQKVSFVVWSDKPMADHEVDDHCMRF